MLNPGKVEKTITAQNTFSDPLSVPANTRVTVAISGIAGGSVVWVQGRFVGETDFNDIVSYNANIRTVYWAGAAEEIRLGIKTGGFGSGSVLAQLRF